MNIQDELQAIHHKYGVSEKANNIILGYEKINN